MTLFRPLLSAITLLSSLLCLTTRSAGEPVALKPADKRAFGGVHPEVSPDGKWIAVSYQGAIGRLPSHGGPLTLLSSREGWDVHPTWSPDGTLIAYINAPAFNIGQLHVIQAQSGAAVKLPVQMRAQGRLWFDSKGQRILGRFSLSGLPDRIAWYSLATGNLQVVSGVPNTFASRLRGVFALSHDSRWILFAEHTDDDGQQQGNSGPHAELWKIPAEGGTPTKTARFPARIYDLCWDAADQGVYIVTDVGAAHNDIWHLPLSDPLRGATQLTTNSADDDAPSVTAGGSILVYSENASGTTTLVLHNVATGERSTPLMERVDFRVPTGTVHLQLADESRPGAVVARVSLKSKDGKFHAPPGTPYHFTAGLGHFYCRDSATLELPAGEYELLGLRGPEYRMHQSKIVLRAGQDLTVNVPLERWTNAAATGWYSGENHIHANYGYGQWYNTPRSILNFCEGEDLRVSNLVVANSDGEAVFDREFFRGRPDPLSTPETILYWNQEYRATLWGHMTLIDLKRLIEPIFAGFKGTTNPWDIPTNADLAQRTHEQNGSASYTHPAGDVDDPYVHPYSAKGLPVDAALGRIDTLDVMGWSYEPTLPFWYRLLNCGIHLPAAAGTDCFLNRVTASLPGSGRAYVNLPGGLSYESWVTGLKAGRSFVSNGPMIELSVAGHPIGDTLILTGPSTVRIRGSAKAQFPLQSLELIQNGVVIASGQLTDDHLSASLDQEVALQQGGWIALRASGPTPRYWAGRSLAAHTNPVYLEMKGRAYDSRADAQFFLDWIDRLERDLRQRDRMQFGAQHVQMQLDGARQYYRELLIRR